MQAQALVVEVGQALEAVVVWVREEVAVAAVEAVVAVVGVAVVAVEVVQVVQVQVWVRVQEMTKKRETKITKNIYFFIYFLLSDIFI